MTTRLQSGASLVLFEKLDSTSSEARRRAATGVRGPLWIVALEQTSGYGRRGTEWQSGAGDVAATFLFEQPAAGYPVAQLSFVAALAAAETLSGLAPLADITVKWPNDVLANGGKIAGILLELLEGAPRSIPLLALGIGINIVTKPDNVQYRTTRLLDFMAEAPPVPETVGRLDSAFDAHRRQWMREGFGPVREAFLARAAQMGSTIRVQLPNETVEGVFLDLDPSGALVLDCGGERRRISAGAILRT